MHFSALPLLLLLLLLIAAPAAAIDTDAGLPRYVVGDILGTAAAPETGMVVANVSTQTGTIYFAYEVVKNDTGWEIPKYWHGDFELTEVQADTLDLHRVDHADPILVIITDPEVTGGDMQYADLSLAEARAGVVYPVEPAPGEPGSGTPLYVTGDILNNSYAPAGGTLIGRVYTNNGQIYYRTYDVAKNGDRWEIDWFDYNGFGIPEDVLIGMGMRRIAHADPHTLIVNDTATNTGDIGCYHLSFAEFLAGEGYGPELWQDQPYPGTPPRYLAGDILGNDTSPIRYVVAGVAAPAGPDTFPIYTTYEVVQKGSRWEIPMYWDGDHQIDALQVFTQSLHRIDHADARTVVVTDSTVTGLSLGEILGGTLPVRQAPVPPGTNTPRDLNSDGLCEDINGNGIADFNDVVIFFNQMDWIAENEPLSAFEFTRNGRIDFNDIVMVFNGL
jgi:PKD repeat protein